MNALLYSFSYTGCFRKIQHQLRSILCAHKKLKSLLKHGFLDASSLKLWPILL
jgi:hypothetical protein